MENNVNALLELEKNLRSSNQFQNSLQISLRILQLIKESSSNYQYNTISKLIQI